MGLDRKVGLDPRYLSFAQDEIHDPATPHVNLLRIATVIQHVVVIAIRILKGIREDGHGAEVSRFVDVLRQ